MANRSLWPESVEVHQKHLEYDTASRVEADRQTLIDTTTLGTVSGLVVSPNSANSTRIDISTGSAYAKNGELVKLATAQLSVALADYALNALNYVVLVYDEVQSQPESHESDGTTRNTKVAVSPRLVVLSAAEYAGLPSTSPILSVNAADRLVLLAVVTANGAGVGITSNSIASPTAFNAAVRCSQPALVAGVTIISVDPTTNTGSGLLNYVFSTKQLKWQDPNGSYGAPVTITASGVYTLAAGSGKSLVVNVSFTQLPGSDVTETLTVTDLYAQSVTRFTARDTHHRSMLGSGQPSHANPHGMTLDDLSPGASGSLEQHQDVQHSHGIAKGSSADFLKCVVDISVAPDRLTVTGFTASDLAYINGRQVKALSTSNIITFNDGSAEKGTYAIILSQDGALSKSLRVRFPTTSPVLDGRVQILNVSDSILSGTKPLSIDTSNKITFDGGVSENLSAAYDLVLRLYSSNKVDYVDVHVDNGAAPVSTLTDQIVFSDLPIRETSMLIAYVPWSGLSTGFLGAGFGTTNLPNMVYDRRMFGTTASLDMSTESGYVNIQKALVDSYSAPVIVGPSTWFASDRVATLSDLFKIGALSGLNVTVSGGMIAFAGRLHNVATTTLTLADNQENTIYVSRNSVLTVVSAPTASIAAEQFKYDLQNQNEAILLGTIVVAGGIETSRFDNTSQFRVTLAHNKPYGVVGLNNKGVATISGPTSGDAGSATLTVTTNDTLQTALPALKVLATAASSRGVGMYVRTESNQGRAIEAYANAHASVAVQVAVNHANAEGVLITSVGTTALKSVVGTGGTGPAIIAETPGTTTAISTNNPIAVGGTNPAMNTGFTNTLSKANICKAWGRFITDGVGGFTTQSGFNVASYTMTASGEVTVLFQDDMVDQNYAISLCTTGGFITGWSSVATTGFLISLITPANGGSRPMNNFVCDVSFIIYGRQ